MWILLMNLLSNPTRGLRTWIVGIAMAVVLLAALVLAGPAALQTLAVVIGIFAVLVFIGMPLRMFIPLVGIAVLIAGAVSLVGEVLASGALPLLVAVGVVGGTLGVWMRAGAPGLGSEGSVWAAMARHVFRGPPPSRGAHWATLRELRQAGFLGEHGWPLGSVDGHTVRLPMHLEREGILTVAAPGSGKTTTGPIPALIDEASRLDRRHVVILDPNDELYRKIFATLSRTHRAVLWDPSNPQACTVGFDPLATLPDPTDESFVGECKQLAQAWFWSTRGGEETTDRFWINEPLALMESLFLAFVASRPRGTFVELADWARSLKIGTFQDILDRTPHPAVRASAETLRSLAMSDRTVGPLFAEIIQRFDMFDDPRVRRSMSGPSWSFGPDPIALYLRVSAHDAQRLAPLLSLALGTVYRQLIAAASKTEDRRLNPEVRLVIDEFGNLPRIYGIETALGTLRSYGVGHYLCAQSMSQLDLHYGQKLARTIQENLVTRIVLGGASAEDAKAFSQRCGEVITHHPNPGWTRQGLFGRGSRSYSYSTERRPLINVDEIIHMKDTVLVSTRGISPIRAAMQPYYKDAQTMRRLEEDRLAFEQVSASPSPRPTERDVPPPGCSAQEWDAAPASVRAARWACEDALHDLVTGRVADLDQLRERWRTDPSRSTPSRYARVTAADRAKSPSVSAYVDELALRLGLRQEDDPEGRSI